ncbi:MAG: RNA 2',3'-cyclic phosphodiesterase [Candidatus Methanoperedens sp.]|nr:RNA 2',3'-cyclic phosphodiesterase [Candidatus Methanoperedens sp.]
MRKQQEQNAKRLFMAINLPEKIKRKIVEFTDKLAKNNKNKPIKWVMGDGLHITLHFLGYADGMLEEQVKLAMQSLSGKFGELKFSLGKISAFPNLMNPRIIFLECEQTNGKSVFKLQELLGEKLTQLGIAVDERPWKPHITLGRVKERCDFKTGDCSIEPLNFSAASFELMESRLTPKGAEYEIIESYGL